MATTMPQRIWPCTASRVRFAGLRPPLTLLRPGQQCMGNTQSAQNHACTAVAHMVVEVKFHSKRHWALISRRPPIKAFGESDTTSSNATTFLLSVQCPQPLLCSKTQAIDEPGRVNCLKAPCALTKANFLHLSFRPAPTVPSISVIFTVPSPPRGVKRAERRSHPKPSSKHSAWGPPKSTFGRRVLPQWNASPHVLFPKPLGVRKART